ncbi:MAG TPA: class I SAM-dependent RNA methyltransferase [Phycisphaerae bacterium]|nr:class I SAM-dependent RNA methyltransferase [Phycisphaerae bacterium]
MSVPFDQPARLRITCAPAISPWLRQELEGLNCRIVHEAQTWVDIDGTLRDALRLNLQLRTAFAVLYQLARFRCEGPDELYEGAAEISWETIIPSDGYLTVASRANHPSIHNWTFANLKIKDAIVDRIADRSGRRPDSGPERTGAVVNVFWEGPSAEIYLNISGEKLSDRGYRRIPHKAPMQETLAAAVLMSAGYIGQAPFVNPMCGSGTLAIEAALIATGRAPGLLRAQYGLAKTLWHDEELWQSMRREARKQRGDASAAPIIASDHDPRAIDAAKKNAQTAGVDQLIQFSVCDFAETPIPTEPGIVIINPEYGERLGEIPELEKTYKRIGDFFKQKCGGWTCFVFSGNRELAKKIHLHESRKTPFWNAKIDCRLFKYEMYAGTRRRDQGQ